VRNFSSSGNLLADRGSNSNSNPSNFNHSEDTTKVNFDESSSESRLSSTVGTETGGQEAHDHNVMYRPVGEISSPNINRYLSSVQKDREDIQTKDNLAGDDHQMINEYRERERDIQEELRRRNDNVNI